MTGRMQQSRTPNGEPKFVGSDAAQKRRRGQTERAHTRSPACQDRNCKRRTVQKISRCYLTRLLRQLLWGIPKHWNAEVSWSGSEDAPPVPISTSPPFPLSFPAHHHQRLHSPLLRSCLLPAPPSVVHQERMIGFTSQFTDSSSRGRAQKVYSRAETFTLKKVEAQEPRCVIKRENPNQKTELWCPHSV